MEDTTASLGIDKSVTVYHGSIYAFNKIDVRKGKPYKDFGQGFYVTYNRSHAVNLALRNKKLEQKFGRNCSAYLYTFEMSLLNINRFKVKHFLEADIEWLRFVITNRKSKGSSHNHDIVIGPTADDDTMVVINAYLDELYGEVDSVDAMKTLLKFIKPDVLPKQVYFATDESTSILTLKGAAQTL